MSSGYTKIILKATRCSLQEADLVEEIMRDVIFHSTLDWQTKEELESAATTAFAVLQEMRANEALSQ
ncbi:MAG: hypothetical protein EXS09_13190 [Gemmataceae bacterium]|nr:hypothetical protein [Gemmataceae bacterium]